MRNRILATLFSAALLGWVSAEKMAGPTLEIVKTRRAAAPVQLTASDGTGLELVRYQANVVVQGPLAFTELHLTFANPQERVLEGHFEITLPDKAALSRLAMKNEKGWQEAEVVELQKARRAYEDFLHRRQDPALLEKQAGNQFQARVFPIPAKGQKELILSYSQEVASGESYRLPVAGLPRVADLEVTASAWTGPKTPPAKLAYSLHGEAPKGDFMISHAPPVTGLVSGDEVLLNVRAEGEQGEDKSQDLLVLVDTSASRSVGYKAQVSAVEFLLGEWKRHHPQGKLTLAAFDQEVAPLGGIQDLRKRRPLGATNLAKALGWAAKQKGYQRLLIVSDGISTAGSEQLAGLLKGSHFQRFDALVMGGIRDTQSLETLVYHSLPRSGFILDGDRPLAELGKQLERQPLSGLKVSVAGADWVWPQTLDGVAPGEGRLVYARIPHPGQTAEVKVGANTATVPLSAVPGLLLHRSAVAANIARLTPGWREAKGKRKEELGQHILELSIGNRVVSDLTGLLVLETEADYARFQIDRKALKDILVVTPEGLDVLHRSDVVVSEIPAPPEKTKAGTKKDMDGALATGMVNEGAPAPADDGAAPVLATEPMSSSAPRPAPSQPAAESESRRADGPAPPPPPPPPPREAQRRERITRRPPPREERDQDEEEKSTPPLTGKFAHIDSQIANGHAFEALQSASQWQARQPGDVLALVALGKALQARGQGQEAARAYGSLIDLYPGRADLRRYAGCLLETVPEGRGVAWDSFAKAVAQRPDHPSGHRLKAYALVRVGRLWDAFESLEKAYKLDFPEGRFAGVKEVLADDLGIVAAALIAKNPDQAKKVRSRLHALGVPLQDKPSLRFVLTWETDANDVDFHIKDSRGGHAYFSQKELPSGGRLYADVTTGYGPECFAIAGAPKAFPYRISIHYYSRGPMGYGMGKIEILRHDGKGGLRFEQRPFVVMNDHAFVDLGSVKE